jgi:hypothetical protein
VQICSKLSTQVRPFVQTGWLSEMTEEQMDRVPAVCNI